MSEHLSEAYTLCGRLLKLHDPDRYIAGLFAPADSRSALHALHAFSLEVAGVRGQVKDPLPGEIRLQWWREAISGERAEEAKAHPVAVALLDTIGSYQLPLQPFLDLIDARVSDLYDNAPVDWNALEGYCGETSSALFRLSTIVLMQGKEPGCAEAAGHAGVAFALTGLLRAFPWHARRGQVYLPQSLQDAVGVSLADIVNGEDSSGLRAALAEMRERARFHVEKVKVLNTTIHPDLRPAFLPLATVKRYLADMERENYNPFTAVVECPQWQRVWLMWRASR